MIKILFVCHGNICRSPMAEFIMKDPDELTLTTVSRTVDHRLYVNATAPLLEMGNTD